MHHDHGGSGVKHMLIMIVCCVIPLALLLAVFVFKVNLGTLGLFAVMLLCPLLHIFMMRGMMGGHHGEKEVANVEVPNSQGPDGYSGRLRRPD